MARGFPSFLGFPPFAFPIPPPRHLAAQLIRVENQGLDGRKIKDMIFIMF
jgi:hypothetical protein